MKDITLILIINIIVILLLFPLLLLFQITIPKIMFIIVIYSVLLIIFYLINSNNLNNRYFLVKEPGLKDKVEYCLPGCHDGKCTVGEESACNYDYECNYCINRGDRRFIINNNDTNYNLQVKDINKQVIRLNNYISHLSS
jgi:hypothetical protein